MEKTIPPEARVRVHAKTPSGYFTWCFGCENTMCGNEVEYPENPDWDKIHKEKAKEILLTHPEWKVEEFKLSGSTRNRVVIAVISSDPNLKACSFDKEGLHISIHPVGAIALKHIPDYRDFFEKIE